MAAATTSGECATGFVACKGPAWSYEGYADVAFACGECGSGQTGCVDCSTDDCNKPADMASDFQCYSWTYVDTAWEMNAAETTCKRRDGDEIMCNAPDRNADSSGTGYTRQNDGCGACETQDKTDGHCLECDSSLCNGSTIASVSAILAAVSSLLFLM